MWEGQGRAGNGRAGQRIAGNDRAGQGMAGNGREWQRRARRRIIYSLSSCSCSMLRDWREGGGGGLEREGVGGALGSEGGREGGMFLFV